MVPHKACATSEMHTLVAVQSKDSVPENAAPRARTGEPEREGDVALFPPPGARAEAHEELPHRGRGTAEGECDLSHDTKAGRASTGRAGRPSAPPVLRGPASEPQATATRLQSGQRGTDGGHGAGQAWGRPEFPSGSRGSPGASRCPPQATVHPLCDRRATDALSATAEAAASLPAWPLTAGEAGGGRASLASPSRVTHTRRPEPEAPGQRHEPRDSLCGRRVPKPASW